MRIMIFFLSRINCFTSSFFIFVCLKLKIVLRLCSARSQDAQTWPSLSVGEGCYLKRLQPEFGERGDCGVEVDDMFVWVA